MGTPAGYNDQLFEETLLTSQSALATIGTQDTRFWPHEKKLCIKWEGAVSAGAIQLKESGFAGESSSGPVIATVTFGSNVEDVVSFCGVHVELAARISTAVAGGTVTVKLVASAKRG